MRSDMHHIHSRDVSVLRTYRMSELAEWSPTGTDGAVMLVPLAKSAERTTIYSTCLSLPVLWVPVL